MKKYTILLLCMACSIRLFSQIERFECTPEEKKSSHTGSLDCDYKTSDTPQYKRCLDGMARWSLIYDGVDIGTISEDLVAYGDTLIKSVAYKKMFSFYAPYQSFDWTNPPNYNNNYYTHLNRFIRESEDASKLYVYDGGENKEYLFSDIDLEIGDSILLPLYNEHRYIYVDSIYFKDNLKHILMDLEWYSPYGRYFLSFIEGIGASSGWGQWGLSGLVNCFQNQTLSYKYQFEDFDIPCGYSTPADVKNVLDEKFRVFVENNNIQIILPTEDNTEINLYNISGLLLFSKKFTERDITIPVSSFLKGVYIVKVNYPNKPQILTTKIIL